MRRLARLLTALAAVVVAGVLVQALVGAQAGLLPLVSVFEAHLLLAALALAAVAVALTVRRGGTDPRLRLIIGAIVVVVLVRVGGEVISVGTAGRNGTGATISLLTWNLELGSKGTDVTVQGIAAIDADVVALQELDTAAANAIAADTVLRARYPYMLLEPDAGVAGMGILAKRPLALVSTGTDPRVLHAVVQLDATLAVAVLDVHPYPPDLRTVGRFPVSLDARKRDAALVEIVARAAAPGAPPTVVAGDLNTAPTEPGFGVVRASLTDAHEGAGLGFGFTWRPSSLEAFGLGLLRIDHVLTGPGIEATSTSTDCSLPGDHCRLVVTLRLDDADGTSRP